MRGNPYTFGEDAPRAFPSHDERSGEPKLFTKGSGRLELAEEIIKQPISSRVIVNRIWRWHIGRGIVDTPSNFGMAGDTPTQSGAARLPGVEVRRRRACPGRSCTRTS